MRGTWLLGGTKNGRPKNEEIEEKKEYSTHIKCLFGGTGEHGSHDTGKQSLSGLGKAQGLG